MAVRVATIAAIMRSLSYQQCNKAIYTAVQWLCKPYNADMLWRLHSMHGMCSWLAFSTSASIPCCLRTECHVWSNLFMLHVKLQHFTGLDVVVLQD